MLLVHLESGSSEPNFVFVPPLSRLSRPFSVSSEILLGHVVPSRSRDLMLILTSTHVPTLMCYHHNLLYIWPRPAIRPRWHQADDCETLLPNGQNSCSSFSARMLPCHSHVLLFEASRPQNPGALNSPLPFLLQHPFPRSTPLQVRSKQVAH